MTVPFACPAARLARMKETCTNFLRSPDADLPLTMAALTYLRIMGDDTAPAEEAIDQVQSAVQGMRLDAHALPEGSPEKIVKQLITDVGQAILDEDVSFLT